MDSVSLKMEQGKSCLLRESTLDPVVLLEFALR